MSEQVSRQQSRLNIDSERLSRMFVESSSRETEEERVLLDSVASANKFQLDEISKTQENNSEKSRLDRVIED